MPFCVAPRWTAALLLGLPGSTTFNLAIIGRKQCFPCLLTDLWYNHIQSFSGKELACFLGKANAAALKLQTTNYKLELID